MSARLVKRVIKQDYHRNGISGAPFIVTLFEPTAAVADKVNGDRPTFLAITMFPDTSDEMSSGAIARHTAVLDLQLAAREGVIEFMHNSWRGDQFGPEIVAHYEKENGPINE